MKRTLIITLFTICCLLINSINFGNASCHGNECIQKYNERIEIYNNALEKEDYITCLNALEEALKYSDYRKEELNEQIRNIAEYLGGVSSQNEDYSEALKYYKKALEISEKAETLYNIGWICYKLGKYKTGITYLEKAKQKTQDSELYEGIVKLLNYMTEMSEYEDDKENRKTNDEYGFYQYYLSGINIFEAREKLPQNTNKVIIAIIDDGVNINHPDLKNKVRTNKNEIPGDGKDNDHNGFIDDYNGRNFVDNNNIISSPGDHGTMVAGIIAANINNKIGISGIVPNIEIMPLMVFGGDGSANGNDIIDAINYAVDNGANIINLSLVQEDEPLYNDYYDYALKKANKKGIIIIASAGNGDKGNNNKGINTTVTKVSPVCNEDNKKNVIGVGSLTKTGTRSDWSNYGECVDFYMYGEDIYTTAVNPDGEPYARAEGTSFSAPIVSGIVGLGYNKFGQLSPEIVYDNLKKSLNKNIINAAKYLDNLSNSIGELGKAIGWLMSNGFTVAKNTNEFNSNKSIRRDEAAKLFVLYANKFNKNIVVNDDYSCIFSDLGDTQGDLTPYVIDACRFGLLSGKNGKFMPKSALTNAQVITVFMRLISGKMDESGVHFADRYFIQAYKLGLINGLTLGNQSNYEKNATRGEVAILLYRGINILEKK